MQMFEGEKDYLTKGLISLIYMTSRLVTMINSPTANGNRHRRLSSGKKIIKEIKKLINTWEKS